MAFLGVCSHTLGIGDTVVMATDVVPMFLCGYPIPFPSALVAKSKSKPVLRKRKLVLSTWLR